MTYFLIVFRTIVWYNKNVRDDVMKKYVKVIYKRKIFASDKGFIIGICKVKETNDEELQDYVDKTITFTGYFADLKEEDMYLFYGETVNHPKYGFQFQVTESEHVKPEDKDGIVAFLSSDLFPGIGEKMATSIVEVLGNQTLDRILGEPECLNLIPKLSVKKQRLICDTLTKYEESHKTIVYLTDMGFTMKDALAIYNCYKSNTIMEIEHNIYRIIDDVEEVTFPKIDLIAQKLDLDTLDERRIKACIYYICKQMSFETGDTYLEVEELKEKIEYYLHTDLDLTLFKNYLSELCLENKLVKEEEVYALKTIYDAESFIVNRVNYLLHSEDKNYKNLEKTLNQIEEFAKIKYNEQQRKAIVEALQKHIVIITGGPGTGKTTIIKAIVNMYQNLNQLQDNAELQIALLAPTGRASKRMSESTLFPATTIHRFLKWNKENNEFAVNEWNPSHQKLIIVDEVSMIDIELFGHLLEGLTKDIQLILVGDFNQLPSVGPGQVLKDLLDSEIIPTIALNLLYRQSNDSYIPVLAEEVKDNNLSEQYLKQTNDFTFLECNSDHMKPALHKLAEQLIKKGYDYKRAQVMAPMYAGVNGIDALNKELQQIWNPKSDDQVEIQVGDTIFRENDKVLQLVNMPEENVFNGDIGVITSIIPAHQSKSKKNEIYVDYDGVKVKYLPKDFAKIKHGFIISIHKSQGSEFELVVMPICMSYYRMLYRKLIYTGITRAKRKLILIGEPKAFTYSVSNNNEKLRKTKLCQKLKNMHILKN